jgi:hypothetical protein
MVQESFSNLPRNLVREKPPYQRLRDRLKVLRSSLEEIFSGLWLPPACVLDGRFLFFLVWKGARIVLTGIFYPFIPENPLLAYIFYPLFLNDKIDFFPARKFVF